MLSYLGIPSLGNLLSYRNTNPIAEELGALPSNMPYQYRGSNDGYDAFRHALISAEATRIFGEKRAKEIFDKHEIDVPNAPPENNMDRWNNDVGRREYKKWKEATDRGETDVPLERWIHDKVKQGETINDPFDPNETRRWVEPPPGTIPDPEIPPGGDPFAGMPWPGVDDATNTDFRTARGWTAPRDPLLLDLDGDGLELKAASGSTLFDHNADGVRTGTGWIGSDDGLLVRDLNGNGSIDTGRELFGVDTIKSDGENAVNGFDALADLDSNADGNFTAADLAWNQVQVWRDLNQDGISDAGELFSLDALGISRIGLVGSATGGQAGTAVNGNFVAQSATFTRAGTDQAVGAVSLSAGAVDLANSPFYRDFTDIIPLTEQAKALPQMQGSGMARDLAEAVSLRPELATYVSAFSMGTTRDAQRALLDGLIAEWAQSSDFWSSLEDNLHGNVTVSGLPAGMTEVQFRNLIGVLEVFNGERFYEAPGNGPVRMVEGFNSTGSTTSTSGGVTIVTPGYGIAPPAAQLELLRQSYEALKESVYGALVLQMRLKPYLDTIELTIDENGFSFDTTALTARLDSYKATNERDALLDLVELNRYAGDILTTVGFAGLDKLRSWIDALPANSSLRSELTALNVYVGAVTYGSAKEDIYLGDANGNSFNGGAGDDMLAGGAVLLGEEGNDSDLEVSIIGTDDKFTVSNWYAGNAYHVEQFQISDGKMLLDSQVQNLVQAMAGFAQPAAGQTTLPPSYRDSLAPVLAANWN